MKFLDLDSNVIMPDNKGMMKPRDINQLAASIVNAAIGEGERPEPPAEKDPAAVALGRKGGQKGGKARADRLTEKQRKESAQAAAQARWKKSKD